MTVLQILSKKGSEVVSIPSSITVFEAIKLMSEKNIGAVLIIENEELLGIFSERDYARKIILKNKASKETLISEIMSRDVITINPLETIDDCMELMSSKRIRHIPVLENDKVIGIISIGDVVKAIIQNQQATIEQLNSYIMQ